MFNLKNLFTHALLALMLVTGAASAAPTYHVTIDTTSLSGSGVLDFLFSGDADLAAPATATLSNFIGNLGSSETYGDVSGSTGTTFVFDNVNGFAELLQFVNLGGKFGFDLSFGLSSAGDGTSFSFALYDESFNYLGVNGDLAQFQLLPESGISVSANNALVGVALVSDVPEPATLASLALGLALMGSTLRARKH
ncbi:NF038129 family PEP-CTERM protein [Massilia sp. CMS3.1]|uniref:NF038129 family PEP-CTERM protein n=1 Tax=Massilia sp. CMS3.1 TaxID=3373083 RepID=UPI003EE77335